jgi:hypothetical protein
VSIKTNFELPKNDIEGDLEMQGQRLARDLSKNFKSIKKQLGITDNTGSSSYGLDGNILTQSFSAGAGSLFQSYTISHGLGAQPSAYIVLDFSIDSGPIGANTMTLFRTSWTTSDITFRLNITTGTASAFSGSFKILALR